MLLVFIFPADEDVLRLTCIACINMRPSPVPGVGPSYIIMRLQDPWSQSVHACGAGTTARAPSIDREMVPGNS